MGKIIMFNPVQRYNIPTEPINPNDVIFLGCSYNTELQPILLIQTKSAEYSFILGKKCYSFDLHIQLKIPQVDALVSFMRENGILRKKGRAYTCGECRLIDFASFVNVNWKCLQIMQYLHSTHQCEDADINSTYQLLGHPITKTILKFVDEEHFSDFKSYLKYLRDDVSFYDDRMKKCYYSMLTNAL